jgi:WD40 repeat protein
MLDCDWSSDVCSSDLELSPDGAHVTTASRDGSISSWDVHLEQREPDEVRRIVAARGAWTLSDGVLVPDHLRGNR